MTLPALSIRQPWAWLIVAGHKDIENRTYRIRYRGRILVHAPLRMDDMAIDAWPWPDIERPGSFVTGGVIGTVEVTDIIDASPSRWFNGPYGYVLRNPQLVTFAACPGQRGRLFTPQYQ